MKIMIVDDCQTTRRLLGHYLKSRGYSVVFAENGLDAIEKLSMDSVNLVMTDLNMPYMDGMELVKTLRADPNLSEIPILMVTTENDEAERKKAFSNGANGYIVKPVTADAIAANIKSIIKQMFAKGG
ncbi:MAG TPA: response regulator [Nitrospirae bacterium]|nr:chemotaxis protein CheY [bacterium BMS3Abin06]HDH13216.1 response regulator [Nitrospirota bacterium]HDL20423.1 response regulator [Nitrospirota bacterium]HDZ01816.1 response regulator [Nitrospirota bacterium]